MKINYSYTEYKDFPEATEISKSRAQAQVPLSMLSFSGTFLSLIFLVLCENIIDYISVIATALFCVASIIYLIKFYPKVTEKKIQKAIAYRINLEKEVKESKFKCKKIVVLDKFSTGTCNSCYEKNRPLTFCKIKKDIGTREIFICSDCMQKFRESK